MHTQIFLCTELLGRLENAVNKQTTYRDGVSLILTLGVNGSSLCLIEGVLLER